MFNKYFILFILVFIGLHFFLFKSHLIFNQFMYLTTNVFFTFLSFMFFSLTPFSVFLFSLNLLHSLSTALFPVHFSLLHYSDISFYFFIKFLHHSIFHSIFFLSVRHFRTSFFTVVFIFSFLELFLSSLLLPLLFLWMPFFFLQSPHYLLRRSPSAHLCVSMFLHSFFFISVSFV